MNERIRELAEQAGFFPVPDDTESDWEYRAENARYEKFAELIVRECMECSTWVGKVNTNSVEPIHTAHAINQRIKQHFGVEE
jgi:hypothetical protein